MHQRAYHFGHMEPIFEDILASHFYTRLTLMSSQGDERTIKPTKGIRLILWSVDP